MTTEAPSNASAAPPPRWLLETATPDYRRRTSRDIPIFVCELVS